MTQSQHTNGPWIVTDYPDAYGNPIYNVMTADEYTYITRGLNTMHGKANAHIIAAAPEMLATLEEVQAWLKGGDITPDTIMLHIIAEAIKKAKGQTPNVS